MKRILIRLVQLIYYFSNNIITYIPIHTLRKLLFKMLLNKVGHNTSFLMGVEIRNGKNIAIGQNCVINKNVLLDGRGGKLIISNNVDIAQETNIWTLQHDVNDNKHGNKGGDVIIKDHVWICSRVTILPGVIIEKGAVVASNSLVTKNVGPLEVVGGIPAKLLFKRNNDLTYELNYSPWFE